MSATEASPSQAGPTKFTARLRKADRRRQLIQNAKQLFLTLGYQHTTTEKIAQAAGVTEPVLYRHFLSKKALFLEVLHEIRVATLLRWQSRIDAVSDPLGKIQAIVDLYLGSTRDFSVELRIMHRTLVESDDPDIAASLRSFYLDSERILVQIIQQGQETGIFRKDLDPRIGAWELIRTALGYSMTSPLAIPVYQEENFLPKAIDCVLRCLLAERVSA